MYIFYKVYECEKCHKQYKVSNLSELENNGLFYCCGKKMVFIKKRIDVCNILLIK